MNRFKITPGRENDFIQIWKNHATYLDEVPGFKQFHLLLEQVTEEYALFASHSECESREGFEARACSEAFRKTHANAGGAKGLYIGHPRFEGFEAVL